MAWQRGNFRDGFDNVLYNTLRYDMIHVHCSTIRYTTILCDSRRHDVIRYVIRHVITESLRYLII